MKSNPFSFLFVLVSLALLFFFIPDRREGLDTSYIINVSVIVILNIVVFFKAVSKLYKTWIRFDVLFIIGFFIVHFQTTLFYSLFDINPPYPNYWINQFVVNYATWLSAMCLLIWMAGFYLYTSFKKSFQINSNKFDYYIKPVNSFNFLLLTTFILFIIIVGGSFWSGNHSGVSNWGAGATYIFLVFRTILFLGVIYFFINNRESLGSRNKIATAIFNNKLLVGISIIYVLSFLTQGDRGPIMQFGLLVIGCYSVFVSKISFKQLSLLIVGGAFTFMLIGLGRTSDVSKRDGGIFSTGLQNFEEKEDTLFPTDELAKSASILYLALDVVPDSHPYLYGYTIFNNLVEVIPMSSTVYSPNKIYSSSTDFFTFLTYGNNPNWGVGSEIIGDLYINFGVHLTILIFFLFGYFVSYLTYETHVNHNYLIILIYLMMLMLSIYLNRSIFLNPLKFVFYLLIFNKFLGKRVNKVL
ncbi:O-antigen polymerase [Sphingobacterium hungaricum]|uniref:Oligosaccharide repeat unit polymerase n=1 Tax=Sphingobacterium hungaricum TaxID=2082723 RepID=A0A928UZ80_9SPHI|nr:O-antigen polymerase [Sphingobacterium hungaricum]MBE8714125.1 hypothetical protein [Sphingobacterium hungaricum]